MSRMYHNEPLTSLPINSHNHSLTWSPVQYQSGTGVLVECTIQSRSRHVITDASGSKFRYLVLHVSVEKAHRRKFLADGTEVEPNFSEMGKVRTGYLHSSYDKVAKGQTDALSAAEVTQLLTKETLSGYTAKQQTQSHWVPLWILEAELEKIELSDQDRLRVKTKGDGPFIETLAKMDAVSSSVANYAGGAEVGGSWTDKVMAVKAAGGEAEGQSGRATEEGMGADDDEWDD